MSIGRSLDALGGKGRSGMARLRAVLEDRGNQRPAMSRLEVKIWRTLRDKGLDPIRQYPVKCGNTRPITSIAPSRSGALRSKASGSPTLPTTSSPTS
jgi:hypothetical protein